MGAWARSMLAELPGGARGQAPPAAIMVYDRTGHLLGEHASGGALRIDETLPQMGRFGPAATLAAEDRSFYQHGPFDLPAMARAGVVDVLHGQALEGGSTIAQQLVKMQLLGPQRTVLRKAQEAYLAWALERRYSKGQILQLYLNRVYYGHGAYGLGAASRVFFDRVPSALSPAQAAFLAALLQAPSGLDPAVDYAGARERELYVLEGMVQTGAA